MHRMMVVNCTLAGNSWAERRAAIKVPQGCPTTTPSILGEVIVLKAALLQPFCARHSDHRESAMYFCCSVVVPAKAE